MILKNKIVELIDSRREHTYWDFKEIPHDNNAALLHDILSLANCYHKGDRYIIIGVADPSKNCEIIGLKKNQQNRKDQNNIVCFLRDKTFAGDICPEVEVKTICIRDKEVDVIVVKDNNMKPYYLTEDYRDKEINVRAFFIYTRNGDTNTPINKSADIYYIEKMWRERFHLDLLPIEKYKILLEKYDEWEIDIGNKNYAYHKQFPEFKIQFSEPNEMNPSEPYCEFYLNNKGYFGNTEFKYFSTTLIEFEYIYCDEMKILLPVPETKYIEIGKVKNWFYYYNLNTLEGLFLGLVTKNSFNCESRSSNSPFLIFSDDEELNIFCNYLLNNKDEVMNANVQYVPNPDNYNRRVSLEFLVKVKQIFNNRKWKNDL